MALIRKLDTRFSRFIRNRDGKCLHCDSTENLQNAHIFTRKDKSVRWDEDNCITLCYRCHFYWAHRDPIEFTYFVAGIRDLDALRLKANKPRIFKAWELEELIERYKESPRS